MKPYRPVMAAGLVLCALAACGGAPEVPTLTVAGIQRQPPAADAPVADVAAALTGLGYRLATGALPADGNAVLSPLSVGYALAMARAGANGATAAQLDQVLGFPATGLHDAFNAITRQVVTADRPPAKPEARRNGSPRPPVVCVGDARFPQRGLPVGEPFLRTLAAAYGAGVHPVDFAGGKAVDVVNEWAREQTAGRIRRVFDHLSGDTKLVLANTIYLRADWDPTLFAEDGVTPRPFTRPSGDTVAVPTMHADAVLRYAAGTGWQAVELPYPGSHLALRILLPAPGGSPGRLLAPDTMAAVAGALREEPVGLWLPRWDFATDLDLVPALRALGLTLPFGPSADFGGISPGLFVDQAIHRANITVDEWGTEAAAVTGLSFATAGKAPGKIQLTVDRPFAFGVVDTTTQVPLFVGQVTDPSAH